MQLNQIKKRKKPRKRIARGGKRGTYAGRGLKGQKSCAGRKLRIGFAGGDTPAFMRLPKKRGTVGRTRVRKGTKLSRYRTKAVVLNLRDIEKNFKKGEIVSPDSLLKKGLISKIKNRTPKVKILGDGKLTKEVKFENVKLSKSIK